MFRIWRQLLGLCEGTVLEGVEWDEDAGVVLAHVRPKARWKRRCGLCGRRSPGYDAGDGRRRWRGLDLGTVKVFVEADAPQGPLPAARRRGRWGALGTAQRASDPGV